MFFILTVVIFSHLQEESLKHMQKNNNCLIVLFAGPGEVVAQLNTEHNSSPVLGLAPFLYLIPGTLTLM